MSEDNLNEGKDCGCASKFSDAAGVADAVQAVSAADSAQAAPVADSAQITSVAPLALDELFEKDLSHYRFIEGGVCAAQGFRACGIHAGFRKNPERKDFAMVVSDAPCACAATFTQNVFCAPPVIVSKEHLDDEGFGTVQAIIINSGNANAATGALGIQAAEETARLAAQALGCKPQEVLVASTGVIGVLMPLEPFISAIPRAVRELSNEGGTDAACAIMTTDTYAKHSAVRFVVENESGEKRVFTIGGMAKGSGMIMPDMATMIAVLTTDFPLEGQALYGVLRTAVDASFNRVTVDSDTSTNDCCFLMSNAQKASHDFIAFDEERCVSLFEKALNALCQNLARQMAADGEGASRLVTVNLAGAATDEDALLAARAVANSPLVKTAIAGRDANWGRVAAAVGKSGAHFKQEDVAIDIMGLPVCRGGMTVPFSEEEALRRFEQPEIIIDINLGAGSRCCRVWTCDFTHDYIRINGDYRT